jgi:hypothetical protein
MSAERGVRAVTDQKMSSQTPVSPASSRPHHDHILVTHAPGVGRRSQTSPAPPARLRRPFTGYHGSSALRLSRGIGREGYGQ